MSKRIEKAGRRAARQERGSCALERRRDLDKLRNMARRGVIYQIIFPNGKSYVGRTIRFKRRMREHSEWLKKNDGHAVRRAIRKYGWGTLQIRKLETNVPSELLDCRERHHISEMRSLVSQNGYNLTIGGDDQPMDNPVVKAWHKKQIKEAMNRPDVRAKKCALWKDEDHLTMMEAARLCFDAAEKRRESFARKRRVKVASMIVTEGKLFMYEIRDRIAKNSRIRSKITAGQQAEALAFWQREWDEYSKAFWERTPSGILPSDKEAGRRESLGNVIHEASTSHEGMAITSKSANGKQTVSTSSV